MILKYKKENMNEIIININDEKDYENKYNSNNLSSELSNYIYEECKGKSINNKVLIVIKSKYQMKDKEKEEIINKIHNNYKTDLNEQLLMIKYSNIKNFVISLLGILFLYLYYFIKINFVLSEMILIVGWVAIWEAVYAWLFVRGKDNIQIKRLKKLANCEIKFE